MLASVLVSTYNWPEALELCLRSVFCQTVKPAEIVVADDGSRDDTRQLIDRLRRETDIPIVHVWQEDKGFRLSAVQNHYSLLYHSSEKAGILDYCKEQGIAFWVYMVLEQAHFPASMTWRILFPKAVSVATHITRYSLK